MARPLKNDNADEAVQARRAAARANYRGRVNAMQELSWRLLARQLAQLTSLYSDEELEEQIIKLLKECCKITANKL